MEQAARIQYFLKLKGKTQKDIALRVQTSEAMISLVISGKRRSRRIENALARIVGFPRSALFPELAA